MPMVAQQAPYTLFVVDDDQPENPREDRDNFGKMVCWHRRHHLGDDHDYSGPRDFLHDRLFGSHAYSEESGYGKPVYDYIRQGRAKEARLEYNPSAREWELLENQHGNSNDDWHVSSSYPAGLKGKDVPDTFLDDCLSALRMGELIELNEQTAGMVMLPLYLYDHSGITMNTGGFSCPWDSGQVGWIYADAGMVEEKFGEATPAAIEKARRLLEAEVAEYDWYLTGQCYGFKLYEGDAEIESCWGFLGELPDVAKHIACELPAECRGMAALLEYRPDIDESGYLEQALAAENEDGMER